MGYVKEKYDVSLTQAIWEKCITGDSDTYFTYTLVPICITGGTDTSSSCEGDDNYVDYQNFQAITGVDFTFLNGEGTPEVFSCMSGVNMTDVRLIGHTVSVLGDGVTLSGLTFTRGGYLQMTEEDTKAKGIYALEDFDTVEITEVAGGTAAVLGTTVGRNMNLLSIQSGGVVNDVVVSGKLNSVYVGDGARLDKLSAGLQNDWGATATPESYGQTVVDIIKNGSASDIYLGYGGTVSIAVNGAVEKLEIGAINASGIDANSQPWSVNRGGTLVVSGGSVSKAVVKAAVVSSEEATSPSYVGGVVQVLHNGRIEKLSGFYSLSIANGGTVISAADAAPGATIRMGLDGVLSSCEVDSGMTVEVLGGNVTLGGPMILGGAIRTATEDNPSGWTVKASELLVTFDLTEHTGGETAMIDNLANLQNVKLAGITVKRDQAPGSYVLAKGAEDFSGTLLVTDENGERAIGIEPGRSIVVTSDTVYSLANDAGNGLVFSIISVIPEVTELVATVDGEPLGDDQWTNKPVTIKAKGNEHTESILYRNAGEEVGLTELDKETGATFSESCVLEITAYNGIGGYSDPIIYKVKIDKEKPTISEIAQDTTEWTESVTVTAKFADNVGLASRQYRIGDGAWSDYTDGVTVTENTTVSFRAVDTAGNEITSNHEVKNVKMEFTGTLENETKEIAAGVTANNVTVNDKGVLTILEGGSARIIVVNRGGSVDILNGGKAEDVYNDEGTVCVDGIVNGLSGCGDFSGGGTFENVNLYGDGARLTATNGGKVINLTMDEYSMLTMEKETTLEGAAINGGRATLYGTEVKGMTVASGGSVGLSAGTADNVSIGASCNFWCGSGVALTNVKMSGGMLLVNSGTLVNAMISDDPNAGYGAGIGSHASAHMAGGEVTGVTLSGYVTLTLGEAANTHAKAAANQTVLLDSPTGGNNVPVLSVGSGCTANDTTVGSNCVMRLGDTAVTDIVKIASGGMLNLAGNATATNIACEKGGYMMFNLTPETYLEGTSAGTPFKVEDGVLTGIGTLECMQFWFGDSTLNDISIQSGAKVTVGNDGILGVTDTESCTSVGSGGSLIFEGNASGTRIKEDGGYVEVAETAVVTFAPTELKNLELTSNMSATIHSGTASKTTVSGMENVSSATFFVMQGGIARDTKVMNHGGLTVSSGGAAYGTQIDGKGGASVNSGGSASGTTVNDKDGAVAVNYGGVAENTTVNKGYFQVGGVASGATVTDGHFNVSYNGSAFDVILNGGGSGSANVGYGGSAVRTVVNDGAYLIADGSSYLSGTVVNTGGTFQILNEAEVIDTTVAGGQLKIEAGGSLKGGVSFTDGGQVLFSLNNAYPGTDVMVDNLADITGNPDYRIAIAPATQKVGSYTIASGAKGFKGTMTVVDAELGTTLGTLKVGESLEIRADVFCSLVVKGGNLSLSVGDKAVLRDDGPDEGGNTDPYDKKSKTLNEDTVKTFNQNSLHDGDTEVLLDTEGSVDVVDENDREWHNFVGKGENQEGEVVVDEFDFASLTLDNAAKLSFTISATDKAKFTIYSLVESGLNGEGKMTYKRKAIQTSALKWDRTAKVYTIDTKSLLLDRTKDGTMYCISVQSTNANAKKNPGSAFYNVELNYKEVKDKAQTQFFADGDPNLNDWLCDKAGAYNADVVSGAAVNVWSLTKKIQVDDAGISHVHTDLQDNKTEFNNFVGFGDAADYRRITLNSPALLSLSVTATDKAKVVISRLDYNASKKKYVETKLQTTVLKLDKATGLYKIDTAACKLSANLPDGTSGEYYISVVSMNAKTGGNAYYNVSLNRSDDPADPKKNSTFYVDSDDGTNGLLYDKKTDVAHYNTNLKSNDVVSGANSVYLEKEGSGFEAMVKVDGNNVAFHNFVGFGDEYDYAEIRLSSAGTLAFSVDAFSKCSVKNASQNLKLTVYSLTRVVRGEKVTWTQKSLASGTITVDKKVGHVEDAPLKKAVAVKEATSDVVKYFVSVQSVGSKNGAEVFYNVTATFTPEAAEGAALTMPETDSLAMTDDLSFGQYAAEQDALGGVSASSLAELDGISVRQELGLLA